MINTLGMNVRGVVGNPNSQTGDATNPGTGAPAAIANVVIPIEFVSQRAAVQATGFITVGTDLPDVGETLTVGGNVFTFIAGASAGFNIQIGADATITATNIAARITAQMPATATATSNGTAVTVTATTAGVAGNAIAMSTTSSTAELVPDATLTNGADLGAVTTEGVVNFSIGSDGKVTLLGSSGSTRVIAYLTLAKFANPESLTKVGNNLYQFSEAAGSFSGGATFSETNDSRKAGTNGFGITQGGALEVSNVDLSEQFTEMIVTQRGFEANARIVTTADDMLQTVVNLKR
jgi:flagellar hook protein FlgE